ncbi:hypothetical protein ACXPZP_27375, partial [Klebsiella pneumoniae]
MLERYVQRNSAWLFPFSVFLFAVMGALKKNGRSEKKTVSGFFLFYIFPRGGCRFQKTAALNVRSRLHYSSGGVGSIRQRRAAAGHQRTQGGL